MASLVIKPCYKPLSRSKVETKCPSCSGYKYSPQRNASLASSPTCHPLVSPPFSLSRCVRFSRVSDLDRSIAHRWGFLRRSAHSSARSCSSRSERRHRWGASIRFLLVLCRMVGIRGGEEARERGMRLSGEIACRNEGEMEIDSPTSPQPQPQKLIVGYALTSKKVKSFLQPKLEGLARKKGILFVAIDQDRPLSDQGPFDIVLHKLTGKEWRRILEDYHEQHPEVTVLDPPDAILHLYNRQSMLQDVADLNLSDSYGTVDVPRQLVITKDSLSIPDEVARGGLTLPLVAKPLSAKSHELSLAYDQYSLSKLEPPLVLQEFVNHGGVLFKVYIVGDAIKVVRRFSLPDVNKRELVNSAGVFRFPRVSCAAASADDADLDPGIAELPPRPLLEKLAKELRRRLGLRLFNIDIIREHGTRDRFYVIDINYFPGYGKMPGYEQIFTDFLLGLMNSKYKRQLTSG